MESILPIIVGILFVVIQAVKSSKKKEAARQRQAQVSHRETTFSSQPREKTAFEKWLESLETQEPDEFEEEKVEKRSLEQILYPARQERFVEGESVFQSSAETQTSVESTLAALNENQSEEEKEAFSEHGKKKHKLFDENFDIKKGIIFSEIFAPKYE